MHSPNKNDPVVQSLNFDRASINISNQIKRIDSQGSKIENGT